MLSKLSEAQRTERDKGINHFNSKKVAILCFFVDFWQQYAKQLHESLLSLASVNRINALETMQDIIIYLRGIRLS